MRNDFPIIEEYRGVGVHDFQSVERIRNVVRPAIDEVHTMNDVVALCAYVENRLKPQEARIFAYMKVEAAHAIATDERRVRPDIDLQRVRAAAAGLGSVKWASTTQYCSSFDVWGPGAREPDERPAEERERLKEFRERHVGRD